MNVEDGLTGVGVAVEDRAEATVAMSMFGGNRGAAPDHLADEAVVFCRQLVEAGDVPARDHEDVHRRLWIDVLEGDHAVVLVDQRRRDLAAHDLAEKAVGHARPPSPPIATRDALQIL